MDRRELIQSGAAAAAGLTLLKPLTAFGYQANSAIRHGLLSHNAEPEKRPPPKRCRVCFQRTRFGYHTQSRPEAKSSRSTIRRFTDPTWKLIQMIVTGGGRGANGPR